MGMAYTLKLHGCGLYLNIAVFMFIFMFMFYVYFIFMFIFTIFLATAHNLWDLSFPARYRTPCPLRWKLGVLTTGPSGKSLSTVVFKKPSLAAQSLRFCALSAEQCRFCIPQAVKKENTTIPPKNTFKENDESKYGKLTQDRSGITGHWGKGGLLKEGSGTAGCPHRK